MFTPGHSLRHNALTSVAVLVLIGAGLSISYPALAQTSTAASDDAARFKSLSDTEWAWRGEETGEGRDDLMKHLPDVGPDAQNRRETYWTNVLRQLDTINPAHLSAEDQVNLVVYRAQIEALLAHQTFHDYEKPVNSDSPFWSELVGIADVPLKTEADYQTYLGLLSQMPRYMDQQISNMKVGLKRGFTPPRITLKGRESGVVAVTSKPAEANPYYRPFMNMPSTLPPEVQARLKAEALQKIAADVIPAHETLLKFLTTDYFPHATEHLAAEDFPNGKAYYRAQIREYTTLDMSPEDIHQLGLHEVAAIRAQMQAVMDSVGFKGSLSDFLTFLRTDPQFYARTPQELLWRAAWISKSFDGKASRFFGHLPRARFAVVPVPDAIAPFYTSGRGGPGIYLVNTYDLKSRGLYSLPALTLHESAPGHAFQMSLSLENKTLPVWRSKSYISAYGEGWALYCEKLGDEMGIYETPYERFGMLSYQMWRAARLVVDTGVHAKHWRRDQARTFLHYNTALSDHEIETEVDRYITWPGQALSYYLGELTILKARHKAEAALGEKFNLKAFHDTVLQQGSVPLPQLEARIDQFIASGGIGPYPDEEK